MKDTLQILADLSKSFFSAQAKYVNKHPGDEDILIKRFYETIIPTYLEIVTALKILESGYGNDDIRFLLRKFAESLSTIQLCDDDVQRSFFYNGFALFLRDLRKTTKDAFEIMSRTSNAPNVSPFKTTSEQVFQFIE